jgi:hypothetical protein
VRSILRDELRCGEFPALFYSKTLWFIIKDDVFVI